MQNQYGSPYYGGYPPGPGYGPQFRTQAFHPMPMIPQMQMPQGGYNNHQNPNEDEDFEVMIKLIDKQRNILGGFAKALDRNKEDMLHDRTKQLKKNIKKMEKESVIRQLKLNNEQARLLKKLNAPYEFDAKQYDLSDVTDSEDDEADDDILLELLSNKIYFKKIKDLMAKKKKLKDKNTPLPDRTDDTSNAGDDTVGDSVVVAKKKKKRRSKKGRKPSDDDDVDATSIILD